ncbi:MAG: family protein phosphatase [Thermoleophilaceae bacterium]|nr:family protein phosphatase [Thermoleophilaceae bacterium]MEA2419112.1 family protein phosphatase [Thermoleophilaceae bacterium]
MTLRIVEHVGRTDVGRQRSVNEDSLVLDPPLFAVADGMGGAKAGEVASSMAAKAFEGESDSGEPAEAQLSRILREANRRIYDLAAADDSHRGMGTTVTAARVTGDEVSLGHVGDSRAYRLRDGELQQLTRDHSLVAELERTGQITPEAAEHHPQRSIITRALGPEPDVEVDTYTLSVRAGDVFLICSDGLTSMISDDELAAILRAAGSLEEAAESLVLAANQSGGKDNITVVMFRLGEGDGPAEVPGEDETIAGQLSATEVREAALDQTTEPHPAPPTVERLAGVPSDATVVAPPQQSAARPAAAPARRERGGRLKTAAKTLLALAVLGAVGTGLYALSRQVYFIGTNDAGLVTLYRGVPYELPFGVDLFEQEYASGVPARAIPASRRKRVLDHEWRGRQDAQDLLRTLERGQLSG